jgi:hypothetical protein
MAVKQNEFDAPESKGEVLMSATSATAPSSAETTILKSSHVAMLSEPKEVLDVILDAAKSVSK